MKASIKGEDETDGGMTGGDKVRSNHTEAARHAGEGHTHTHARTHTHAHTHTHTHKIRTRNCQKGRVTEEV